MSRYRVSYKVLRQQGEDMKAAAKMVDGYIDRLSKIRGRLGSDNMLAGVRNNLQQLGVQLGESRAILNTAGDLLVRNVESYGSVEVRQVRKVGGMRAHNRDFYKNPVVVVSAGGAAVGAAAVSAPATASVPVAANVTETSTTTINYTDNSVNVSYAAPGSDTNTIATEAGPLPEFQSSPVGSVQAQPVISAPTANNGVPAEPSPAGMGSAAKVAAGLGAAGVAAAGAVLGGREIKKRRGKEHTNANSNSDPETELENARRRLAEINEDCGANPHDREEWRT